METIRGTAAIDAGRLTRADLRRDYRGVHRDVWSLPGARFDARDRAVAAWQWNKGLGALTGWSAAAVLGVPWVPDEAPAEISRTDHVRSPVGILVRKERFNDDEIVRVEGMLVTSPARTAYDLGRRIPGDDAVVAIDAVCHQCVVPVSAVRDVARRHTGARGVVGLRAALDVADAGSESPWETRTRLRLIGAGLPRPTTQIVVRDGAGAVVARLDMGWDQWRVAVEYDGAQHWLDPGQRRSDLVRGNRLQALGWTIVRVDAATLRTPEFIRATRTALRTAGAPIDATTLRRSKGRL